MYADKIEGTFFPNVNVQELNVLSNPDNNSNYQYKYVLLGYKHYN